jgi:hypothetical protein
VILLHHDDDSFHLHVAIYAFHHVGGVIRALMMLLYFPHELLYEALLEVPYQIRYSLFQLHHPQIQWRSSHLLILSLDLIHLKCLYGDDDRHDDQDLYDQAFLKEDL